MQVAAEVLRTCFQQEAVTLGALEANTMRQKQCLREDRDAQVSSIARQAQNAADQGDLHVLFKLSKGLGGFVARTIEGVQNKAGVLLVQKPHIDARRAQHFAELLLDRGQDNIPEPSSTFGAVSAGECEQRRDTEDELNYLFGPEAITEVVKYVRARRAAELVISQSRFSVLADSRLLSATVLCCATVSARGRCLPCPVERGAAGQVVEEERRSDVL